MQIDDPDILSYTAMSQAEFWRRCREFDGNLTLGVAFDENGFSKEKRVLLVKLDPYSGEDEWVTFEGEDYFVDMDVYTARDVTEDPRLSPDLYPVSLAYYFKNDAFLPSPDHPFIDEYRNSRGQVALTPS